ncbi:MAG: 50S ribosomal protein L32 [Chloroflexi bacterium]|nr:50S ribosomal protein L32 [Chloroflexota bacterium]
MTPLPKKKHTRRQRGNRRAHKSLSLPGLAVCPCPRKVAVRPHRACPQCGNYKGRTLPGTFILDNLLDRGPATASAAATEDS